MAKKILLFATIFGLFFSSMFVSYAQTVVNVRASDILAHTDISFSPQTGTFLENSTFDLPIFLNTEGNNVNAVELNIKFDPSILTVIKPSAGKSIIGLWIEPPTYDNTKGTARIVGTIPQGINTNSGLLATITFKAKISGQATISVVNTSKVLLNDGLGSPTVLQSNPGQYTIVPKPPEGVQVFSETHPLQDQWYNNNSPVLSWNKDPGVTGFSYVLDNKPNTIPDNTVLSSDTTKSFENLSDGLWYFHIKALKNKIWGTTSDYLVRIDTTPPAEFKPTLDYLSATVINRFLVSFFTTDSLSGIDHYEVGVIDKSQPLTTSPAFVQTDSPYQIPFDTTKQERVIVRAFDKAGNTRDESIDVRAPVVPLKYITDHATLILLIILGIIILLFIIHYLFGHRILRRLKRILELMRHEETFEAEHEVPILSIHDITHQELPELPAPQEHHDNQ